MTGMLSAVVTDNTPPHVRSRTALHCAIVIPARLESSRLPRKLLLARTGQPLICHTAEAALRALSRDPGRIREVVVAVDDESLLRAVRDFAIARGAPLRAQMTRADHRSGSDRIAEVAAGFGPEINAIVNLQGDEPEMEPREVLRLLDLLETGIPAPPDLATLAWPLRDPAEAANPNLVKVVCDAAGRALYFSRAAIPYDRDKTAEAEGPPALGHLGIYAFRRDSLERFVTLPEGRLERRERLEQLRALEHGMRIAVGLVAERPPKGIDTEADYCAFIARQKTTCTHCGSDVFEPRPYTLDRPESEYLFCLTCGGVTEQKKETEWMHTDQPQNSTGPSQSTFCAARRISSPRRPRQNPHRPL